MYKITEDEISVDALYKTVLKDSHGAVVTFAGVVRDHSGDKRTNYLEYEAYTNMAEKKMAAIAEEARNRWGIEDMAILHRVGRLEIGEISVLIAVASPHRAEGLAACTYAINRLKEIVPIWKKRSAKMEIIGLKVQFQPLAKYKMIPNFSWIIAAKLAGSGHIGGWGPYDIEILNKDLAQLKEDRIRAIVSLTERPLDRACVLAKGMNYLHIPIPDMTPPDLQSVYKFVEFVDGEINENRPVLVHCEAGLGRTGTMLGCYLVKLGTEPAEAINKVRLNRPGSIETPAQEATIFEYAADVHGDE